jgi:hypothetical protein
MKTRGDSYTAVQYPYQPCASSLPCELLLCLGVKTKRSGAGPKNISEILTHVWLLLLASKVSVETSGFSIDGIEQEKMVSRTKFIPATVRRRSIVQLARKPLEEADGDVAVLERERFAKISPSRIHAGGI